ncbi:MAG: enoyl-CoA hydratase/isomerase family protein, partial [SAR202 cluster bacterium]
MAETILYEKTGNIVTITLNRPDSLNAINRLLRQELADAILEFDGDPEAFVAVITGSGRAFCSGRDLKERAEDNAQGVQAKASASMTKESPFMWPRTWKPMIAAVNGFALAGGWSIAQICDLRIGSEEAKLGISETKWSLLPPFGS